MLVPLGRSCQWVYLCEISKVYSCQSLFKSYLNSKVKVSHTLTGARCCILDRWASYCPIQYTWAQMTLPEDKIFGMIDSDTDSDSDYWLSLPIEIDNYRYYRLSLHLYNCYITSKQGNATMKRRVKTHPIPIIMQQRSLHQRVSDYIIYSAAYMYSVYISFWNYVCILFAISKQTMDNVFISFEVKINNF